MCLKVVFLGLGLMLFLPASVTGDHNRPVHREVCQGEQFPSPCDWDLDDNMVNCSSLALSSVPDTLPLNTRTLLLYNNNISRLAAGSFWACENLQTLDLSLNAISLLKNGAFDGLQNLTVLLLSNNSLQPDGFSDAIFSGLGSLKTLHIHNNKLARHYHGKFLVKGCPNVETLSMDGLQHSAFGEDFGHLKSLLKLKLYGNLADITNDTFKAFNGSLVTTLILRSGQLASVQPLSFAHFHYLETLDLSFNPQLGLQKAAKSWYGLQHTNVSSLILKRVSSKPTHLGLPFYNSLKLLGLKHLVLDSNNIINLGTDFHQYLSYIEHLSLAYNNICVDHIINNLSWLEHLRYLDVSFQTPVLLDRYNHSSYPLCSQQKSNHRIGASKILYLPPNLEVLNLTSSSEHVPPIVIGASKIRHFSYARNNLRRLWSFLYFYHLPDEPVVLDLSVNYCEEIDALFFVSFGKKIEALHFSDNKLGSQLAGDKDGGIFRSLTRLTYLDLSENNITTLPRSVFLYQQKLRHLNLSNNNIAFVSFCLSHMTKLLTLDLSSNRLKEIDGDTCEVIAYMATLCCREGNLTLDLSNNPLEISCNTLPFLEWTFKSPNVNLKSWQTYTGVYKNTRVPFSLLQHIILPELTEECVAKLWLKVACSLFVFVIVVLVLAVLLFRNRFEVRYLCLRTIINRKRYQALEQQEMGAYFEYDAFVAFDQNDLPFVQDKLQPTLEGDGVFRLCIHHRDFGSGPIEENILSALHSSRKIILLLSSHFVNSSWCRYELQMARLRCFDEGRDLIIPVVLDDLPVRKLNRTLRGLLRKNTYIEWPESQKQQDIDNFWLKMRRSLQLRPDRVVRCQCGRTMNQKDLI